MSDKRTDEDYQVTPAQLAVMALTRIPKLSQRMALELLSQEPDATLLLSGDQQALIKAHPDLSRQVLQVLANGRQEGIERAEREAEFCSSHEIKVLCFGQPGYPYRLAQCPDAPVALYCRGNANLDAPHILSMVGTRHITEQGKELCHTLTQELAERLPDTLIVSGLAYGADIHCHRGALDAGLPTVAVLAHGLDRIYPSTHRATAISMLDHGGLLTEYMTETNPDKGNFVRRNRIVAGLCDGCIVIESAHKGGAMITAHIAQDYNRDVMALPGRPGDIYSQGCNDLIRTNVAALVTSADDILEVMNWQAVDSATEPAPVEPSLFPELSSEELQVIHLLRDTESKQINQLVLESGLPVQRLTALLFTMELKGLVRQLAGGCYRLLYTGPIA